MKTVWKKLQDALFPKGLTCNVCDAELSDRERKYALCTPCYKDIKDVGSGFYLNDEVLVVSAVQYGVTAKKLILKYKDSNCPHIAEYLALFMAERFSYLGFLPDFVTYPPSSQKTLKKRGYDAMGYVAKQFGKITGLPVRQDLEKKEGVADQSGLKSEQRRENIKGAFRRKEGTDYTGKNILLLDDLVTSGATLSECADACLLGGAEEVVCLTFATAGGGFDKGSYRDYV